MLGIDPIDGTRHYRDRTGNGYSVMLHARSPETVHYLLVYLPEEGPEGTWLEARADRIVLGSETSPAGRGRCWMRCRPSARTRLKGARAFWSADFRGTTTGWRVR